MASTSSTLRFTPPEDIAAIVKRLRTTFLSHKTRPMEFRIKQLRKLYWSLEDHTDELMEAFKLDLNKGYFDVMVGEVKWVQAEILATTKNLAQWAADESIPHLEFFDRLLSPTVRKDPLGTVLVVGPFNFPVQLTFVPVIGAIAAGNTVLMKPSEHIPNVSLVMQKIVETGLDPDCYACMQGGIPEMKAVLAEKWDKIFFTGSPNVGKVITQAAAPYLTPVTLELGGRNPAIITKNANVSLAARRLLWGKTLNAGQACYGHNYTLIEEEILDQYVAAMKKHLRDMFPNGAKNSPDFSRIVDVRSCQRIKKMLDDTSGQIVYGGEVDIEQRFIEPTIVVVKDHHDSLLAQESFGPLMPIVAIKNLDQAIQIANSIDDTPLAIYPFGSKAETDRIVAEIRSGCVSINDSFAHGSNPALPVSGVGQSGMGATHGKATFEEFVHRRTIVRTPSWMEFLLEFKYYPHHGTDKYKQFAKVKVAEPNFDRAGNEKINVLWYMLTLGSKSATGGLLRASMVAGLAVAAKFALDQRSLTGLRWGR